MVTRNVGKNLSTSNCNQSNALFVEVNSVVESKCEHGEVNGPARAMLGAMLVAYDMVT